MSDEEIEGRNFVLEGNFSPDWKTHWTHNEKGTVAINQDALGSYLLMNQKAMVTQLFDTTVFTERQMEGATYKIAFRYENLGGGADAGVLIRTSTGKEHWINLSGITPEMPLANWNDYPSYSIDSVVADDKNITLELQAPDVTGSSGLCITDIEVQLHLVPLQLKSIQIDDRVYETSTSINA
ncbi:MAG: hypothetical protein M3Q94_01935 [Pseudomonadota bacterium]|nr:hypothetical protein [Pseudomonadota bacterium]